MKPSKARLTQIFITYPQPGEQGKPGVPGIPGTDGTNEPGPVGPPGNRGQTGRPGKPGTPGEPGQDAVQLIGVPGPRGDCGPPGFPGPRGDPGTNGIPAAPGQEGAPGSAGDIGDPGDYGPRGPPGKKGPPGQDGGYCQCPPRDGTGVPVTAGPQILPPTWNTYQKSRKAQARIPTETYPSPEELSPPQYKQKPTTHETYGDYGEYRRSRTQYKDQPRAQTWRSPTLPMIDYVDSRESTRSRSPVRRVAAKKNAKTSNAIDFELRAK
ncbi:collagen triple helix repeat protein [Oesophagostomum dentatum]|uniref:Collagen triple helix repeat protein n=1 Tax=Oesophagostomum dentatum TaxID=61180 RepID=A0A0B1SDV6_OESDE|nr:collagen triple helix repeat protein [Oesophagostomum dentatum]